MPASLSAKIGAMKSIKKGDMHKSPLIKEQSIPDEVGKGTPETIPPAAGVSGEDLIRGSANIPLSSFGEQEVKDIAKGLRERGGVGRIMTSDLKRAQQTASTIADETGAATPEATDALHPWHLGQFEGRPTKQVLAQMDKYISDTPDKAVPGRGKQSTADGESFNEFKSRFLGFMQDEMAKLEANPNQKELLVTHFRGIKVLQSWLRAGMPDDLSINAAEMMRKDGEPGTLYRFAPGDKGKWSLTEESLTSKKPLQGGIYIMRHGHTEWNGENKPASSMKTGE